LKLVLLLERVLRRLGLLLEEAALFVVETELTLEGAEALLRYWSVDMRLGFLWPVTDRTSAKRSGRGKEKRKDAMTA
jgi:hypothetical protein